MRSPTSQQEGFALIESMIALVVFAILLIALLNYSQYITLNFNWIFYNSIALRELQSNLERTTVGVVPILENSGGMYPDWQLSSQTFTVLDGCRDIKVTLSTTRQALSLNRWFCRTGDNNVSGLSF